MRETSVSIIFKTRYIQSSRLVNCLLKSFIVWSSETTGSRGVLFDRIFPVKVAEHSFSACSCWCNLARAQGFQKTNVPSTERSLYLLKSRTICVIFLYNCMQCIDGFSILLQRYVIKGNDAKNLAIFSFCLLLKEPS